LAGVRVVTDSACDLPDELLAELGIGLVSLRVRFGADEYIDRVELSTKDFWSRCSSFEGLPETSAPSPGQFQEAFQAMAAEGADEVVCVNLSSKMSATIESARQAARALEGQVRVSVIDSLSVSMGEGLIAIEAAQTANRGGTVAEVLDAAEAAVHKLRLYGVIDTLENLKKGGRIGGAQALVGSLLAIKPVVEVRDGEVQEESKQRTRGKAMRYLAEKIGDAGPIARLALFAADPSDLDEIMSLLDRSHSTENVLVGDLGPVIGTHAGPGSVGAAWIPG
jgi:DegV family protein with EDD domain